MPRPQQPTAYPVNALGIRWMPSTTSRRARGSASGDVGNGIVPPGRGIVLAGGPVVYARQALEVTAALVHIPIR
jgi:hypothetical protein